MLDLLDVVRPCRILQGSVAPCCPDFRSQVLWKFLEARLQALWMAGEGCMGSRNCNIEGSSTNM